MQSIKVIIPIYKTNFSDLELKTLKNNLNILSSHKIVIVCPKSLNIDCLYSLNPNIELEVERFDDFYFKNIEGYNKLMLSSEFYSRFLKTEYILICQTDAFVFRDELLFWCEKNYDYIGAPWIGSESTYLNILFRNIDNLTRQIKGKKPRNWEHLFKVGNGGFSLRKVASHHKIASEHVDLIEKYLNSDSIRYMEDAFWALKAPELAIHFEIPKYREAIAFAIDRKPKIALQLNNKKLPFGCHGINKPRVMKFWKPIIDKSTTIL